MAQAKYNIRLIEADSLQRFKTTDTAVVKSFSINSAFKAFENRRLSDYSLAELNAQIPMMIFSPTVVNDGRRLLISSQPISYLTQATNSKYTSSYSSIEDLEFNSLFKENNSKNIKMLSVLRMNATFPYILPMVLLPTEPSIEIMDAGIRDNFGMKEIQVG